MARGMGYCAECDEYREIVGDGKCRNCYQRDYNHKQRGQEQPNQRDVSVAVLAPFADRGHRRWVREQNREYKRLTRIALDIRESGRLSEDEKEVMNAVLHPHIQELADTLKPREKFTFTSANGT